MALITTNKLLINEIAHGIFHFEPKLSTEVRIITCIQFMAVLHIPFIVCDMLLPVMLKKEFLVLLQYYSFLVQQQLLC